MYFISCLEESIVFTDVRRRQKLFDCPFCGEQMVCYGLLSGPGYRIRVYLHCLNAPVPLPLWKTNIDIALRSEEYDPTIE
jgi:hypothetical protein